MEKIHISDVISLLRLPHPKTGQSSYYIRCPCCDDDPRKEHLNINLIKDVFRCPRCGVSGGIFDLYSLYTGIPRSDAFKSISDRLGVAEPVSSHGKRVSVIPMKKQEEYPINDVGIRNATYTAFLAKLSLAKDHAHNLFSRGLSAEDIERNGYKTTPVIGMRVLAKQLQSEGHYLSGIPGFYRNEDGEWVFVQEKRGILIPVRNRKGEIQGLQLRCDNVERRKFRWISSTGQKDGCRAEGWIHVVGTDYSQAILTEGPMKADVIHALTGKTVIAVPGVNALTKLREVLDELKTLGLREIKTAFDMDFALNPHVQAGYNALLSMLDASGFRYRILLWDPSYKGLDDYIYAKKVFR